MFFNQIVLHTDEGEKAPAISYTLSFEPFLDYLDQRIRQSDSNSQDLLTAKEEIASAFPDGNYTIPEESIPAYESLFRLVYRLMTNPLTDENSFYWGIGSAFSPKVIYGTNAFRTLLNGAIHKKFVGIVNFKRDCALSEPEVRLIIIYSFLIKRFYNINIFHSTNLVFSIEQDDRERFFQVDFEDRFIRVSFDGALPQIDKTITEMENMSKVETLEWLEREIPLSKISFTGFSILEIKDVTEDVLKGQLRNLLLTTDLNQKSQTALTGIVRKLAGCPNLDVLLLPILYLNNRIVTEVWQTTFPDIQSVLTPYGIDLKEFNWALNQYANSPRLIFRENIQRNKEKNEDLSVLSESGVLQGLIIKPIFTKGKLIGIILIASQCMDVISDQILTQIEESIPLIQNLFEATVGTYRNMLDRVIKTKFTSIQPSVEWKFNEVALRYLKDKIVDKHPSLLPIRFENVYPIYGAIDFRNSTVERNQAQIDDWVIQLEALAAAIGEMQKNVSLELLGEWKFRTERWIDMLNKGLDATKEFAITHFLEKEAMDMLLQLAKTDERCGQIVRAYLEGLSPHGAFHRNTDALEKTFKILNANIASILDQMNDKLQDTYPCYFERYRTDGIEFNIYIGQSITPEKPFNQLYLKNVQLWQLNTMALIAKITEKSQATLPRKIHTTQLIFIHSNTITTSFRMDERRFDVEGGYNIRYEIIKKRIDKAMVKGTGERLTQPGKIAIVYFQKKDIEDYLIHISYLQQMNILNSGMEEMELEEMQGVSGLKALRVSVTDTPLLEGGNPEFLLENPVTIDKQAVAATSKQ